MGTRYAPSLGDHEVRVHDLQTGQEIAWFPCPADAGPCVSYPHGTAWALTSGPHILDFRLEIPDQFHQA